MEALNRKYLETFNAVVGSTIISCAICGKKLRNLNSVVPIVDSILSTADALCIGCAFDERLKNKHYRVNSLKFPFSLTTMLLYVEKPFFVWEYYTDCALVEFRERYRLEKEEIYREKHDSTILVKLSFSVMRLVDMYCTATRKNSSGYAGSMDIETGQQLAHELLVNLARQDLCKRS